MRRLIISFLVSIGLFFLGYYLGLSYNQGITLEHASFREFKAFNQANLLPSLQAFKYSCQSFLKQPQNRDIGTQYIPLKVRDFMPVCLALNQNDVRNTLSAKKFIKEFFSPYRFYLHGLPIKGLFTGYYLPSIQGSLIKTKEFNVPIYEKPDDLVRINLSAFSKEFKNKYIIARIENQTVLPYHSRKEINEGKISEHAKVIAYIKSRIDRLFLGIQGSGYIILPDGNKIIVSYEAQNGKSYTALAGLLIKDGIMNKDNASMQRIKQYLEQHPEKLDYYLHKNESFVFFRTLKSNEIIGAQNVPLTAGYSLAIDRKYLPLGLPLWLSTTYPNPQNFNKTLPFNRLMIAQDTGGAIRGPVRGDIFWGGGENAAMIAGHMKNSGFYWILLPKTLNLELKR